jgi:hypothetical protein
MHQDVSVVLLKGVFPNGVCFYRNTICLHVTSQMYCLHSLSTTKFMTLRSVVPTLFTISLDFRRKDTTRKTKT